MDVRHAATVALQNALTFAHNNFSNDSERNYVMQIICEGTLAGEQREGWLGARAGPRAGRRVPAHGSDRCTVIAVHQVAAGLCELGC